MKTVLNVALGLLFAAVVLVTTGCGDGKSSSSSKPDEAHEAESGPPSSRTTPTAPPEAIERANEILDYCNRLMSQAVAPLVQAAVNAPPSMQDQLTEQGQAVARQTKQTCVRSEVASYTGPGVLKASPDGLAAEAYPAGESPSSEQSFPDAGVDQTGEPTSSSPVAAKESGTFKQCDPNITARKGTTNCAFASNVFYEYWNSDQAENVRAYSSIAGQYFRLRCAAEDGSVVCRTSEGGVVKFPQTAVDSYSREHGQRYARSHDIGPE